MDYVIIRSVKTNRCGFDSLSLRLGLYSYSSSVSKIYSGRKARHCSSNSSSSISSSYNNSIKKDELLWSI